MKNNKKRDSLINFKTYSVASAYKTKKWNQKMLKDMSHWGKWRMVTWSNKLKWKEITKWRSYWTVNAKRWLRFQLPKKGGTNWEWKRRSLLWLPTWEVVTSSKWSRKTKMKGQRWVGKWWTLKSLNMKIEFLMLFWIKALLMPFSAIKTQNRKSQKLFLNAQGS